MRLLFESIDAVERVLYLMIARSEHIMIILNVSLVSRLCHLLIDYKNILHNRQQDQMSEYLMQFECFTLCYILGNSNYTFMCILRKFSFLNLPKASK